MKLITALDLSCYWPLPVSLCQNDKQFLSSSWRILGGNGNLEYGINNTLILMKDFIQLNFIAYTSHQIRQEELYGKHKG